MTVQCGKATSPDYFTLTVDADVRAISILGMMVQRFSYDAGVSTFFIRRELAAEHGFDESLPASDCILFGFAPKFESAQ